MTGKVVHAIRPKQTLPGRLRVSKAPLHERVYVPVDGFVVRDQEVWQMGSVVITDSNGDEWWISPLEDGGIQVSSMSFPNELSIAPSCANVIMLRNQK